MGELRERENSLTFAIVPTGGDHELTLGALYRSVGSIQRLIGDVDWAVEGRRQRGRWVVERLQSSTPMITVRPASDGIRTVNAFTTGIGALTRDGELREPPPFFSDFALRDLQDMAPLFRGREAVSRIDVIRGGDPVGTVDQSIEPKVERIYGAGYAMLSSVEGRLEAINVHRRRFFTVWDRLSGGPVRCALPGEQDVERVKGLLGHSVLVSGLVNYFANGVPRSIHAITEIEALPSRGAFRARAGFGAVPDLTGDLTTDEFVHSRRD